MHDWYAGGSPTEADCEALVRDQVQYYVDSEPSTIYLSQESPIVLLVKYNNEADLGIFRLMDKFPARTSWVEIDRLMERDETNTLLEMNQSLGCIGYSCETEAGDMPLVETAIRSELQRANMNSESWQLTNLTNMRNLLKPSFRTLSVGTLDVITTAMNSSILGVSATLWKDSSGGPCVTLTGKHSGAVVGLVEGYTRVTDPYNIVNAFPNGLRDTLKGLL